MNMSRVLKYDMLFQFRHGFYYAYLLVSVLYIILIRNLPSSVSPTVTTLLIFSDTSILGFFFIGGIVLLEKGQHTLESLFVTPFQMNHYFVSKIATLTAIAICSSLLILICGHGFTAGLWQFLAGVILSSIFFTLIGFTLSSRVEDVNHYLIQSFLYTIPFILPILGFLDIVRTPLYYILPTQATLILLHAPFQPPSIGMTVYAVATLAIWTGLAYLWARNWFHKYVILNIGGAK